MKKKKKKVEVSDQYPDVDFLESVMDKRPTANLPSAPLEIDLKRLRDEAETEEDKENIDLVVAMDDNGWIPVSSGLIPRMGEEVLVWVTDGLPDQQDVDWARLGFYSLLMKKWQVTVGNKNVSVEVSHWHFLPPDPVGKG